jgi:CheY-like chemotaxis protein
MNGSTTCSRGESEPVDTPTVLHIDDDPVLLELTRGLLGRAGGEVLFESDPTAVAERLGTTAVDAVVSDHEMPVLNGGALLERVRAEHPTLPFALFIGRERGAVLAGITGDPTTRYVRKHGTTAFDRLASTVRSVVGGGDGNPRAR